MARDIKVLHKSTDESRPRPIGVSLKEGDIQALADIAEKLDVERHAVMQLAIWWFIREFNAGNLKPEQLVEVSPKPKNKPKRPE